MIQGIPVFLSSGQPAFLFFKNLEVDFVKKKRKKPMRCPYCGALRVTDCDGDYELKPRQGDTMLYVCSRYPECDAYVRVQPGKAIPLGTLANGDLRGPCVGRRTIISTGSTQAAG